jgi:hypothetical protein
VLSLIVCILGATALALFITQSVLLNPIRERIPLLLADGSRCTLCMSFWGALVVLIIAGGATPLLLLATWGGAALLSALWLELTT